MPSSTTWNNILLNEIIKLQSLGLTIIIAHIERYSSNQINKLMEFDVLTQINAYSLFSPIKWFRIRKYIKSNVVTFIASDSHIYNHFFAYKYLKKSHNMIGSKFNTYMNNAKNILSL
jgi:tyrosine-protein phosphatase YwqE